MKLILDEEAVLSAVRAHVVDVLGLANVEIQHIRGIVPRRQDAMLTIEVEVSRIVSQEAVSTVSVPVQQVVAPTEDTAATAEEPETVDEEPEGDESKQLSIFDQEEVDEPQAEPETVVVAPTTATGPLL